MKIIDILNKIANGEEIKFILESDGDIFHWYKYGNLYNETQKEEVKWFIDKEWLNEEVEIIKEDKKIEKLELTTTDGGENTIYMLLANKIDEIIDFLNKEHE